MTTLFDEWRKAAPVRFAALEAIGKRGAVELEHLWPAVDRVLAAVNAEGEGLMSSLMAGALLGAMRMRFPSVDDTVDALIAKARSKGSPLYLDDVPDFLRATVLELLDAGTKAALDAQVVQEPA
jgi:hypothetical protein